MWSAPPSPRCTRTTLTSVVAARPSARPASQPARWRGSGSTVVISALEGMAGVGKTRLAVHAGHQLLRAGAVDRVLFVNLRGFHPDPGLPPAGPAAVVDGFLRLLGVPGHQVPHDLPRRV